MVERESEAGLREVVHQRVRLGVLAVLARRGPCTFSHLRDALGQSDGGLSRHLGVLEQHGYITTEKVFENRRPRTWVRMTETGAEAFREEQELLAKLLASATQEAGETGTGDGTDNRTADMAIVFAALLAGDDGGNDTGGAGGGSDTSADETDRSGLVPTVPAIAGRPTDPIASGPISARYDFPADYAEFGFEQREQRLMMMSHGLRGGWISTWRVGRREQDGDVMAHVMVVELAGAPNCEAILAMMSAPTLSLPGAPGALGYLVPAAEEGTPATAVAWFCVGRHLASVVVTAAAVAVPVLDHLVSEAYRLLSAHQS
ncbi:winged helix-turn-helix domain-containing protein [Streptomyces sp. NPDC007901]|uniref:winged helix-turn-helix domain-containing protein n=1 Tax=Streptomyces sp. NPDC007901 TaxID=3364785 RepID=UPI0036EAD94D